MAPRHHTVPQMYLRNFANEAMQVALAPRDEPDRTHLLTIRKAVSEVGFYRIEKEELERDEDREQFDPESIEHALSGIEGAAAPALEAALNTDPREWSDWDYYRLFQFISLQTTRGNRWRREVSRVVTEAARAHFLRGAPEERARAWLDEQGGSSTQADATSLVESAEAKFPTIIPPKALLVQESMKMAFGIPGTDDLGLTRFLAHQRISVLRPRDVVAITSDEPVCWWSPETPWPGYANSPVVWMPLSPRAVLQLRDPDFDMYAHGLPRDDDGRVAFVNDIVSSQAERWVIHHPDHLPPGPAPG